MVEKNSILPDFVRKIYYFAGKPLKIVETPRNIKKKIKVEAWMEFLSEKRYNSSKESKKLWEKREKSTNVIAELNGHTTACPCKEPSTGCKDRCAEATCYCCCCNCIEYIVKQKMLISIN